jgi:hypothetical protein
MLTYHMQRTRSRSLKGKLLHFQLNKDSTVLFHAKLKSDNPTLIFIGSGSSVHGSSSEFAGAVFVHENATHFSVRRTSQSGEEFATISYRRMFTARKPPPPRTVAVRLFARAADVPNRLFSRKPSVSCVGEWSLDFGSRPVVASVKNAIFVDKADAEMCPVMKIAEDTLRIDVAEAVDPLVVFALGVSSFVCKLPSKGRALSFGQRMLTQTGRFLPISGSARRRTFQGPFL